MSKVPYRALCITAFRYVCAHRVVHISAYTAQHMSPDKYLKSPTFVHKWVRIESYIKVRIESFIRRTCTYSTTYERTTYVHIWVPIQSYITVPIESYTCREISAYKVLHMSKVHIKPYIQVST